MTSEPWPRPKLILRAGALAGGYTDGEIRRLRARGVWTSAMRRSSPGTQQDAPVEPADRHRAAMTTLRPRISGDPVFSHLSAAVLHRLPLWRTVPGPVQLTRSPPNQSRRGSGLHTYTAHLEADEITVVDDWPVTSVARTVLDLARTLPFEQALVVADAALHRNLTAADQLAKQLERSATLPGVLAASRVIAFADELSESIGQTRSRIMIHRAGLPKPELQLDVLDEAGRFVTRGHFGYRRQRVIGRFDGGTSYTGRHNQHLADERGAGKPTADALPDANWSMVKWIWADLDHPAGVVTRLQHALRRGAKN